MPNSHHGSALITALFIMTLVAIAATAMSARLRLDLFRTQTSLNSDKLYLASQAVTWWAMDDLSRNNTTSSPHTFPKKLQRLYPGVLTEGALFDLQAKINLNSLQDNTFLPLFYRLMENKSATISTSQRKLILEATMHWINAHQLERGNDSLSSVYLKQKPPYYPGYQPMRNVSEFRLVQGVTTPIYQALLPYITALPEVTPININTASRTVLRCLGNGLDNSQIEEILQARDEKGGINMTNLPLLLKKLNIPKEQVTVESRYFLSVSTTSTHDSHLTVYTVIKRTRNKRGEALLSIAAL